MSVFVMTGVARVEGLHILRADLMKLANDHNHFVGSQVTSATDYLVTDSKELTVKRKAAELLDVKIISTEEFIDMLGGTIELVGTLAINGIK